MTTAVAGTRRPATFVVLVLATALLYVAATRLSLLTAFSQPSVTPLWLPAGLALPILLRLGRRLWPGVLLGSFLALWGVLPGGVAAVIAAGNTAGLVLACELIIRYAGGRDAFRNARDVLLWMILAAVLSSVVSATVTTAALVAAGIAPSANAGRTFFTRWLGNAGSIALLAPAVLLWWQRGAIVFQRRKLAEGLLFIVVLVIIAGIVFGVPFDFGGRHRAPNAFLFFPLLAWAAFRFGARATATGVIMIGAFAIWAALLGIGPFALEDQGDSLLLVQAFLGTSAATTLAVAAAVDERQRAQRQVAVLNVSLEQRVAERTAALARAEAEEDRQRFLSEASKQLGTSLEQDTMLEGLARLAVPRLADWCAIYLVEDAGIRQVTLAHVDPGKVRAVQELSQRFPPRPDRPPGYQRVINSGEPILIPRITEQLLVESAQNQEQLEFGRSLGLCSAMTVPLIARGRTLGALSFATTTASGRTYTPADLDLAMELGRRVAIAVDNSRLYHQTQEAVRVREDFLAIASHELRTPVASLRLQVQILERALADEITRTRGNPDPWLMVAGLQRIVDQASTLGEDSRRLVRLVNGLLDVTRISTGKLDLHLEDMDFRDVVRAGIDAVRPEIGQRNVRLTFRATEPMPGRWDRLRLEQVVANLLSNAIKYGEGRPIAVRAEPDGRDQVVLVVQDQGIGVSDEFRGRMFDRFEQASGGTQGLGLGLYITRQIVQGHGGRIDVESTPGVGTTFTVHLPRMTQAAPAPEPEQSA